MELAEKSLDLMAAVLGTRRAQAVIDRIRSLEKVTDVPSLRPALTPRIIGQNSHN
jgi:hypothetical protein